MRELAAAGTTDPVIGPAEVNLQEGTATFVHAIGKLDGGELSLVSFTVSNLHSSPSGVATRALASPCATTVILSVGTPR